MGEPGPGRVSVDIDIAGLCHSDLKPVAGDIPQLTPVVLGHEAIGRVAGLGEGVNPAWLGKRVTLTVLPSCGTCEFCSSGREHWCRASAAPAPSPFTRHGRPVHQFVRLGAFASRTVVGVSQLIELPESLDALVGAMLGCATVTAFGAAKQQARIGEGDSVLVTGVGGVGLNSIIAARHYGARHITAYDVHESKRELAFRCGADEFHTPTTAGAIASIAPAEGFDVVLECTGAAPVLREAFHSLGWGGRCVIVGLPAHGTDVGLEIRDFFNDKSLHGCRMGSVSPQHFIPQLAASIERGELDLSPVVSALVPPQNVNDLITALGRGELARGYLDFRGH
ncbi:alcohol dehydrogenase catalytic domain-containing protein (plasmid) [Rhodococcus pyridinivorans]|uniref:zinc-binding dehydrogenase n=1 Tax=Rhodococcus TaxID=1827 RepID=UPI0014708C8C|nr:MULTISPECIES: zinc-binding dehydrogenase [Rhodococcus]MCT7293648.1 alcohol dehydrogenase catalytic domain-containing protein [Rhodococcus sp. PAE-6]QXU56432.1 alcohol dehydrogenase catalytic domain-containing protein [Rhodococcus sp. LW-XY12]UQB75801.1 alcohol dehydrogenase catalytic domain-containing protein [Rhodococcus ruber]UVT27489.1 alcohol dehydrogenase catalytic domain-containing protein [Rhodococcus pyridinivorans]WML66348.1 alcohol dehydrogenase catalytic domain-containing protein